MFYSYKGNIDGYEIRKMAPYFLKKNYIYLVGCFNILNLLISVLIFICFRSISDAMIIFLGFLIFSFIYYKVKFYDIITKIANSCIQKRKINPEVNLEFYDSYLIRKSSDKSLKINYDDFKRFIETDTNFYLQYLNNKKKRIIIIQKNNCELELIQFIRSRVKNIENHLGGEINFLKQSKLRNSKMIKIIKILLIIVPACSIFGGLYTAGMYNEINDVNDVLFYHSSWIIWLWLPLPILSLIISLIFQKHGIKCTKNIIISSMVSVLLLIEGSFWLYSPLFADFEANLVNDYSIIEDYEQVMDVRIPSSGKLKLRDAGPFNHNGISNLDIVFVDYAKEDTSVLANDVINSDKWILSTELSSEYKKLVPSVLTTDDNMYYLFYNKTLDEYNIVPDNIGTYQIYTMIYNISKKTLSIFIFDYKKY